MSAKLTSGLAQWLEIGCGGSHTIGGVLVWLLGCHSTGRHVGGLMLKEYGVGCMFVLL